MRILVAVDGGDVVLVSAHGVHVGAPPGRLRGDAVADGNDDDGDRCGRDDVAPTPPAPRRHKPRIRAEDVLRPHEEREGKDNGTEEIAIAKEQRERREEQDQIEDVAERRTAVEPDVRQERQEHAGGDGDREGELHRPGEGEHRREEEHRGDELDRAQGAEIVVDEDAHHAAGRDVEREAGRVGMVRGDVEVVQRDREEALVPIPHRSRKRHQPRQRDGDRERQNDLLLTAAHRALHS